MKLIETYEAKLPSWAMSYIINNDASGLEDYEIRQVDEYLDRFYQMGSVVVGYNENEEPFFCSRPAFGLACDVLDCDINIYAREG
jgi:hypothetical protein